GVAGVRLRTPVRPGEDRGSRANPCHPDGKILEEGQVFAARLLSQSQVEGLGEGVKEIKVAAGTVVTPLAVDLMKRRGISLRVVSGGEASVGKGTGEWAFAIEGPTSGKAEAIRRALLDGWAEVASPDLLSWLVAPGRGALFLTPEASVAVWRANRVEGIRAASACEVDSVSRAVRHLGLNLLVIEPSAHSIPSVKAMAEAFRRGGAPAIPEGLR
ncbi:MAG TPA: hypothetical protein VGH33_05430, partial [Isosphaeraceae bacterium]